MIEPQTLFFSIAAIIFVGCVVMYISVNHWYNDSILHCILIVEFSLIVSGFVTLGYSFWYYYEHEVSESCVTMKVTNQSTREINRSHKSGGPYTQYIFYVDNENIDRFMVDDKMVIPEIVDGKVTVNIIKLVTNGNDKVMYKVDTDIIDCKLN